LVTTNLGAAFNTTFQALLLSVPLMLLLQHLERFENQHLTAVDERWALRYLPRLQSFFAPAVAAAPATTTQSPGDHGAAPRPLDTAAELQTLSSQIMGLRAIMTDLHETVYLDALQKASHPNRET
jgi:hypothetical protein